MTPVPELTVEGWVGTVWKPIITVHDTQGAATDAEAFVLTLRKPDDSEESIAAPKVGPGEYQPTVVIASTGPWVLLPKSTNPTAPGKLIFNAVAP
jgi:hypothetical protein